MPIKKYFADADNVITNALKSSTSTSRRTGSNAGAADILEVYTLYGRRSINQTASTEIARTLIKFPISDIISDRSSGVLPGSGSVTFKLKMYNAKHFYSLPFGYDIQVAAVSSSWEEGYGIDLESYADLTQDGAGSNWMNRTGDNIKSITAVSFSSDRRDDYSASAGGNYVSIYNYTTQYGFWFYSGSSDSVGNITNGVKVNISASNITGNITAVSFSSDNKDDYKSSASAGPATNYLVMYDGTDSKAFWFYSGSLDDGSSLTNHAKVDISGSTTSGSYAEQFRINVLASSSFAANRVDNIVYLTASTGWNAYTASVYGSIPGIGTSVHSQARTSIAEVFRSASNNQDAFTANRVDNVVYLTASAAGAPTAPSIVGSMLLYGTTDGSLSLSSLVSGANGTTWTKPGGDYYSDASSSFTQTIKNGTQDLDIDITPLVEQWINSDGNVLGDKTNYGVIVKVSDAYEPYYSSSAGDTSAITKQELVDGILHNIGGVKKSYFTKMFFGRSSEFYYKRPTIEAQYDNSIKDDRNRFYISSSLKETYTDNLNRLYFFNSYGGRLLDIGGKTTNVPTASFYYSSGSVPEGSARGFLDSGGSAVTSLKATRSATGSYYIDVAITKSVTTSTYPYLVDVWSFGGEEILTGSVITPIKNNPTHNPVNSNYILSMPNLLPEYHYKQTARLRVYVRNKNWSPNIYTTSKAKPESTTIVSGSYRILRVVDDYEVQAYGTGSVKYSALSYDGDGNYFDLNMQNYEIGYQYAIRYAFYDEYTKTYIEQPYEFKFRVTE